MTNENNALPIPVSNWTLATGTQPGRRFVRIVVVGVRNADDRVIDVGSYRPGCEQQVAVHSNA